jgi:hypothetical protein
MVKEVFGLALESPQVEGLQVTNDVIIVGLVFLSVPRVIIQIV